MAYHKKYYKREGDSFPSSLDHDESCESMHVHDLFVH
jgi:hypothetical protein